MKRPEWARENFAWKGGWKAINFKIEIVPYPQKYRCKLYSPYLFLGSEELWKDFLEICYLKTLTVREGMSHIAAVTYDRCFFWLLWRNWTWTFWTSSQRLHVTVHLHQGIFSWTHSSSDNVLLFHLIVGNSRIILFLGVL